MKLFEKALNNIDGGRVLDVATQEGDDGSYKELMQRAEELQQRLYNFGAQREPVFVAIGKK